MPIMGQEHTRSSEGNYKMTDAQFDSINASLDAASAKTTPGKQRTRLNAYRHGLTGQIFSLTAEEKKAFDVHCTAICADLAPVGALESTLAEAIAQNHWRLKRIRSIETGIFAAGMEGELGGDKIWPTEDRAQAAMDELSSQARTWRIKGDSFQLLATYEGRINRTIERNMAELRTLRAERQAVRDRALAEAALLAQHAQSKGEKYDAIADFPPELLGVDSVFSASAITLRIARTQRLNEARDHAKSLLNPKSGRQMPAAA